MKLRAKHRSIWPSVLFGSAALGLALIGWSLELADLGDQALDISLHDTYYVMPALWPWYGFIGLLLAFAVIYLALSRWLDSRLSLGHFVLWIPLPLFCLMWLYVLVLDVPRRYYSYTSMADNGAFIPFETIVIGLAAMFLLGALLFLLNVGFSVVRSLKPTSQPLN